MHLKAHARGQRGPAPKTLLTAALLASTALASPAFAQTAPAAPEATVGELIVTAQPR